MNPSLYFNNYKLVLLQKKIKSRKFFYFLSSLTNIIYNQTITNYTHTDSKCWCLEGNMPTKVGGINRTYKKNEIY